jgi:hypothetical protein
MKQPIVIVAEAENEDYYAISEARKEDQERKSLLEEKNEKNQYGSSYDFSYDCNNVFECAGLQDNSSFSVVTDYEENSIFMVWSPEEIKYYYELMLQQSIEQDIDDCIQKGKQPTYEKLEEFASIKDKRFQEPAEVLRTKNNSQLPSSKMKKNKAKMKVKQNRVKMKHIWSNKPRKKLHLHHYLTTRKVKMKLLESSCKPS